MYNVETLCMTDINDMLIHVLPSALGGVLIYLVWLNNIKVGGCNKEKIVALNMENPYTKLKLDWILDR